MIASVAVEETLLLLKVLFVVLLYLFIWYVVRSAARDLRAPQESFILPRGAVTTPPPRRTPGRLVVVKSPTLAPGTRFPVDSAPLTVGRSDQNDIPLDGDEFASARHARLEPRGDGLWLEDEGSTNGTYVNGMRIERPKRLDVGDVVRIGETDLKYES